MGAISSTGLNALKSGAGINTVEKCGSFQIRVLVLTLLSMVSVGETSNPWFTAWVIRLFVSFV